MVESTHHGNGDDLRGAGARAWGAIMLLMKIKQDPPPAVLAARRIAAAVGAEETVGGVAGRFAGPAQCHRFINTWQELS